MSKNITYELKGTSFLQRKSLREVFGRLIYMEYLGNGYWNVSCEDEHADQLSTYLDESGIQNRFI
jgi:hypothetical protein